MMNFTNQTMWTGDNLPILRGINSDSIDLIYLDPPFNSNANYAAPIGSQAAGAEFKDTWSLSDIEIEWIDLIKAKHPALYRVILAAMTDSDKGYLVYMAPRLLEMHRILKDTGSIYLHCDPTMSHYLKLVMDAIFGRRSLINEIIWHYSGPQRPSRRRFGTKHDTIFRFAKTDDYYSNSKGILPFQSLSDDELDGYSRLTDGRYYYTTPRGDYTDTSIERLASEDRVQWTRHGNARIRHFLIVDKQGRVGRNKQLPDVWIDIVSLGHAGGKERLGYPTQKPVALLKRIIEASSTEGDIVLDPFAGCATTCIAAEELERQWIGIDISKTAVKLVNRRLKEHLGLFYECIPRPDLPVRSDLGKLPAPSTHKKALYGEQGGHCNGCDEHFQLRNLEVDHIIARKVGGTDVIENLQLLCGSCNRIKGARGQEYLKAKLAL